MGDSEAKGEIRSFLQSGIGVAALSVAGYLIAFCYELGYTRFFGIPFGFIRLNLVSIFVAILGLASLALSIVMVINGVYLLLPNRGSPIYRGIVRLSPFSIIFLALLFIYKPAWLFSSVGKGLLVAFALLLFGEFAWPLITQRGKGTYLEKLKAQEDLDNHYHSRTLAAFVASTPKGLAGLRLVLSLLLLNMFSYCIGNSKAIRQEHFWVLEEKKDTVVLRIYNDKIICAPFDRETKKLDRSLIILEGSGKNELRLKREKVGPLKLADR